MARFAMRLFTDRLEPGAERLLEGSARRVLYVAEGGVAVTAGDSVACLAANSAWHGGIAALRAGAAGARILRYEIAADGGDADATLGAAIELDPASAYLIRCDRVEFPPGGVAYTHTHQGPGLRCLQLGRIRIETAGTAHEYAPGEAWFESGPDPVFAAGSQSETTAFVRVMVLPRTYLGRSSIRYIKPEDQDKPKRQSYQIYIDAPLALPGRPA
jgi:quercetin dioxygenase-like cupin family protein